MRPLNLGETLQASIDIVRARWQALAIVMLVVAVPITIATVIITATTIDDYKVGSGLFGTADTANDDSALAGSTAVLVLTFLGYLLGTVACYRTIADAHLGRETGAGDSLRFAGERLGATLWLTIVLGAGLVVGFLALIVPGIWLAVAWSVAYPAMLVEGKDGFGALQRSYRLTAGRWWATCGRLAVAYILILVIDAVISAVFSAPFDDSSFAALLSSSIGSMIVSLFATPFVAAVTTLMYFDLRVRKEGWSPDGTPAPVHAPVAPSPAPSVRAGDVGPDAATPTGWAPPVAPEPREPPLWDPHPDE